MTTDEFEEYLKEELEALCDAFDEALDGSPYMADDLNPIEYTFKYFDHWITRFTAELNDFVDDNDANNTHNVIEELCKVRAHLSCGMMLTALLEKTYVDLVSTPVNP